MKKTHKFISVSVIAICSHSACAQEVRMREDETPAAVRSYVREHCSEAKRLRYFKETEEERQFIEVEFVEDHREHSIKFEGDKLIETEVEIGFDDITLNAKQRIEAKLKELYTSYKIIECQEVNSAANPQFEIEIKGAKDHYYELLFDHAGNLINQSEIVVKPISSQF
jgi:hypothetical protein